MPRRKWPPFESRITIPDWKDHRPGYHWIYAAQEVGLGSLVKIGYTSAILVRFPMLQQQFKCVFVLVAAVEVPRKLACRIECHIHKALAAQRIQGEWFYLYMTQAYLEQLVRDALTALTPAA